jgi:hypothetical protein
MVASTAERFDCMYLACRIYIYGHLLKYQVSLAIEHLPWVLAQMFRYIRGRAGFRGTLSGGGWQFGTPIVLWE